MNRIAVYAGSFDPVTKGHIDIIRRSSKLFEKVIIGVLNNVKKTYWFNSEERMELIETLVSDIDNVEIRNFEGLLVDFMEKNNANILIRGLRAVSDYELELQMALTNHSLAKEKIETIFLTASRENLYLSSSIVKEIALYEGSLEEFVDERIIGKIKKKAKTYKAQGG